MDIPLVVLVLLRPVIDERTKAMSANILRCWRLTPATNKAAPADCLQVPPTAAGDLCTEPLQKQLQCSVALESNPRALSLVFLWKNSHIAQYVRRHASHLKVLLHVHTHKIRMYSLVPSETHASIRATLSVALRRKNSKRRGRSSEPTPVE